MGVLCILMFVVLIIGVLTGIAQGKSCADFYNLFVVL